MAIIHEFKQIFAIRGGQGIQASIIEDEEIGIGPELEQAQIAAIPMSDPEHRKEPREAQIAHGEAQATGQLAEGTGEPGFAGAFGPREAKVVMGAQPVLSSVRRGVSCPRLSPPGWR